MAMKTKIPQRSRSDSNYPTFPDEFKVWIEGQCFRSGAVMMFARAGCKAAESPEKADLVVFLGGEDVDPKLYDQKPHPKTHYNPRRDEREIALFNLCIENKIPMFGICRGMQLIHVLSGGSLYQNVNGHADGPHAIIDLETGSRIMATSIHHQMCIETKWCIPLAYAEKGTTRSGVYEEQQKNHYIPPEKQKDLEAACYLEQRAIGVQGHPEVSGQDEYTSWCLNRVLDFLSELASMDAASVVKEAVKKAEKPKPTKVTKTKEGVAA